MAPLGTALEITKLAAVLESDEDALSGLAEVPADELRALRKAITTSVHSRHERRFVRLAAMVKLVPPGLAATIAERALGPVISARVAAALDPTDAVRLAGHLKAEFLSEVAIHLDPARVADIVGALPGSLVQDVGRRVLKRGELPALAGLMSAVSAEDALAVATHGTGPELLRIALLTDEPEALDALVAELPESLLRGIIAAAADTDELDEAVLLTLALSAGNVARILGPVVELPDQTQDRFVAAVARQNAWASVLPGIALLPTHVLGSLVNLPSLLTPAVLDDALRAMYDADLAQIVVPVVLGLDDTHLDALATLPTLHESQVQDWLIDNVGASPRLVTAVLRELGLRS